jgi:hypothetical protein
MLKSFIQTFVLYNVMERVVLASWFDITIELDAYREYFWLVRSVSPWFVLWGLVATSR